MDEVEEKKNNTTKEAPGAHLQNTPASQVGANVLSSMKKTPVVIYTSSLNGPSNKACISPQIEELLGLSPSEWLADPCLWLKQIHPDDRIRVLEELARCEVTAKYFISEYRMLTKDGRSVWVRNEAQIVRDESCKPFIQGILIDISQQKQVEEELQQRERYFRALIENSLDIITIFSPDGTILYESPSIERILGYKPEELIGKNVFDLVHPDDLPRAVDVISRGIKVAGAVDALEFRFRHKDGSWRYFNGVGKNLIDDPDIKGIIVSSRDITEHKRAEEALEASEQRYRTLIETSPECIFLSDMNGIIVMANQQAVRLHGYNTKDEMVGKSVLDFVTPEEHELAVEKLRELAVTGSFRSKEFTIVREDGTTFSGEVSASCIFDQNGKPVGIIGVEKDISERKRAEEVLKASENKYKTLVENIPQKVFLKDKNSLYISCNKNYANDLKISPDEITGKTDFDFYPRELAEKYRADDKRIMESWNTEELEEMYVHDGQKFVVHTVKTPVRDKENNVIGVLGIFWDITERKHLEEMLLQSQKMETVGKLAGGIAHDLNNILTVITSYAGFVKDALQPNDPIREDIGEILNASTRATLLIRQLLAFSRRQVIKPQVVNLNDLIINMDKMLRRLIGEDIHLVTLPSPDLGFVKADTGQIEQVIANLAVNARDAMPHGGTLTIETANVLLDEGYVSRHPGAAPGMHVMLAISDSGMGMSDDVKKHLFEPFFTTKEVGKGSGLGLATVYGIIKQHKGTIWVYSEQDKGTTFKIYLPMTEEAAEAEPKDSQFSHLPRGNETLLVAEDEMSVRSAAVRILRGLGYTILEAGDGEEALRLVQNNPSKIHLLLTDVVMPMTNGKELADRLRAMRPGLKILFMSGYTDNTIMGNGAITEGTDFIQKPFSEVSLAQKIRELLDTVPSV